MNLVLNNRNGDFAHIDLSLGAALTQLNLNGQDVIKYPLKDGEPKKGYPSAILFPFPNRVKDGKYTFEGKEYSLEMNDLEAHNAIHGLVAFETFELISRTPSKIVAKYVYKGLNEGYPFPFEIKVIYQLKESSLLFNVEVTNSGSGNMPYGFGWHPYFGFDGTSIGEMTLKAPKRRRMELNERYIPTGEYEVEKAQIINLKNNILDNVFAIEKEGSESEVTLRFKKKKLIVSQKTGKNKLNYMVLYIPPSRNCIAIEPQSCNTNAFNNDEGLLILASGKKNKFDISVSVEG
ncbi:MAG: aldose 1-epimerase [Arcticibacterium sp.]